MDMVDEIVLQWKVQRPDLDPSPMAVIGRLSRATRDVERQLAACFAEYGLQAWEFDVLAALRRAGDPFELSPSAMTGSLMISSSAMTNRIDRLEQAGLVERRAGGRDRRVILIRLTERGREVVDQVVEAHLANEQHILAALSPAEQQRLGSLLKKLSQSLQDEIG